MKTKSRIPIEPSDNFAKELKAAEKSKSSLIADGISITPPLNAKGNWRLRATINGRTVERSGGKSLGHVNAAFLELKNYREYQNRGELGLPEKGHFLLADAIAYYFEIRGPKGIWKHRTKKNRSDDFNHLNIIAKTHSLKCLHLNTKWMREFLANATATQTRATTIESAFRTFMEWGYMHGYFTKEQYEASKIVRWSPPAGSNYKKAPTRRAQSKQFFGDENQEGGEVPTHEQVLELAEEAQKRYIYGKALVITSANMGTRAAETLIYTASKKVAANGNGNYVDLANELVNVSFQINDDPTLNSKTTKNGKRRKISIPRVENISTGFNLLEWLEIRSVEALKEQEAGINPLALIFPNKNGGIYTPEQVDEQVIRPSTNALGWLLPPYKDARGKERRLRRFTLHSMRDRYGVTAAEEWKYTDTELLQQGSWSDLSTVRKFYMGFTDMTQISVQEKHKQTMLKENHDNKNQF
jgi:hypothetical protein